MEDELERIKHVLDTYKTDRDKVAFLLRQFEWLLKVNNAYKSQIEKDN